MSAKILVVDDDPAVRMLTCVALESAGFDVVPAADGPQALSAWSAQPADLVVLDKSMPGMTGTEVAQALRQNANAASVPIVMLSAMTSDQDQWDGWRAGIDMYVTKPYECEELIAHVKRLLNQ
ncbi:MAG: response regulator transcription factor [Actinomycetota bacterium]